MAATDTLETLEKLLEAVFCMRPVSRLYNEESRRLGLHPWKYKRLKLGGGQAYDRSNDIAAVVA
jgi:hypothetical protein